MPESWRLRSIDPELVVSLQEGLAVHSVTARCLAGRGVTSAADGRAYLEPRLADLRPPQGLAGLPQAIDRLERALTSGERIGIFGDYDADGVTTAALLTDYLQALGATCETRVARRDAGYGFGIEDARALADAGCTVVITGDCGTSDLPSLIELRDASIDTIVIDHHTVPTADPENPHPAFALINPYRADSEFPFRGLASVGLAFYVMAALRSRLRSTDYFSARPEPDIREQLDLVALGTIADLVPLVEENRILVRMGLEHLQRSQRPGLRALLDNAGVAPKDITERTVGFKIGPRLNAPGRLGDAKPALDMLLASTPAVARAAAAEVEQLNQQRRIIQDGVLAAALEQLGDDDPGPAVVVAGHGWASGVVGIVAARLVDIYQRPAFVIAIDDEGDEARGSCRSFGGVNLYDTLKSAGDILVRFGGHAAAAGLTMDPKDIDELRQRIADFVSKQASTGLGTEVIADAEVSLADLDHSLVRELESLAPFGKSNAEPTIVARNVKVRGSREVGTGHLKLQLVGAAGRTIGAIGFGLAHLDPGVNARVDLVFRPVISTWAGRVNLELQLRELAPSQEGTVHAAPMAQAPSSL